MATDTMPESTPVEVPPKALQSNTDSIPPLQAGDRLTRDEFMRRYQAMPHVHNAELIEGVVYMPSPVSRDHSRFQFALNGFLFVYESATPGVEGGDNGTLLLDLDNAPQPDGFLRLQSECGGQSEVVGQYIEGAPELIAEVAASSKSYDLHDKLNAYRRNGVREYIVWRVWDKAVDWFVLEGGDSVALAVDDDGILRSRVLPGLWLIPQAIIAGDRQQALQVLNAGLASQDHQDFADRLASTLASQELPDS